jgi:enoyl-CoA hydratase
MAASSTVLVERDGPVTIIRINRPAARNAINAEAARALREAWQAFDSDETARVGILTGGEDVFCAGADLKDLPGLLDAVTGEDGPLGFARSTVGKPTIAAIAGYCVAGGLGLACWCDLRIAEQNAVLGCFERRFGVPLVDGGTLRLPRIIGLGRALELVLTGRPVAASEAHMMGLVNEMVAPGQGLQRAIELGKLLASFPQTAMLSDRQSVYQSFDTDMIEGLIREAALGQQTLLSQEAFKGAQQFQAGKGRKGTF